MVDSDYGMAALQCVGFSRVGVSHVGRVDCLNRLGALALRAMDRLADHVAVVIVLAEVFFLFVSVDQGLNFGSKRVIVHVGEQFDAGFANRVNVPLSSGRQLVNEFRNVGVHHDIFREGEKCRATVAARCGVQRLAGVSRDKIVPVVNMNAGTVRTSPPVAAMSLKAARLASVCDQLVKFSNCCDVCHRLDSKGFAATRGLRV